MSENESTKRKRVARIYPAWTFEQSLGLAEAIQLHASGERVNRLTLFKALDKSPTSSGSQNLITNSTKYGLTKGSFKAEYLELSPEGRRITEKSTPATDKFELSFKCAIESIPVFKTLYDTYKGKKLPAHEIFADTLRDNHPDIGDTKECIDIFVVNCRYLDLLQNIAGAETLVSADARRDEIRREQPTPQITIDQTTTQFQVNPQGANFDLTSGSSSSWDDKCFYITAIGEEDSPERKHSDLFLSYLIEPALRGLNLTVVRADQIGEAGMITSQILEHILKCRLCIVDLSFHNPNVFYEMAIRHASNRPVVQICRKADKLPFDVNQIRTVIIDDSDIYTLIPNLESFRSEISMQAKGALEGQSSNPISVFFPGTQFEMSSHG